MRGGFTKAILQTAATRRARTSHCGLYYRGFVQAYTMQDMCPKKETRDCLSAARQNTSAKRESNLHQARSNQSASQFPMSVPNS